MTRRLLALLAVAALGAGGCGGKHGMFGEGSSEPPPPARAATDTPASALRAQLTALLTDHVYLAGVAVNTGLASGFGSPAAKAAFVTVARNSADLTGVVRSVYGAAAASEFLKLWQQHVLLFAGYARSKARGSAAAAQAAKRGLDGYRERFATFIAGHNPNLPKAVLASALEPQVAAVLSAIDAAVERSPAVFARLENAAASVPQTALALAGGIVKQFPGKYAGAVDDGPATLRATLTTLLDNHVHLAGIAIATGIGSGFRSPAFKTAAGALDGNSVALSKTFGSAYGGAAAKRFLELWRAHIALFVDYAKAQKSRDRAGAQEALAKLDAYRQTFGEFISAANPNLTATAVARALEPHIATVTAAIRAAVKQSPKTFDRLREAAMHMPATADVLAAGIAKQFPDRFPAA